MAVKTNNIYGVISISNSTIESYIARVGLDSYGIVGFARRGFRDKLKDLIVKNPVPGGVKVKTNGDKIGIDVYIIVKYGVSIRAVAEAFKESIEYKVSKFSGMIVDYVNVNVVDVRR